MYTNILISTDGSEVAQRGVDHGLSLAKALGAKVVIISVTEPIPFPAGAAGAGWVPTATDIAGYEQAQKEQADELLGKVREAAQKLGVETKLIHAPDAWPAEAIVQSAKAEGCNLIVMASHGRRGLGRLILGSQTAEVLASSPIPVLVVK
ncbi:MAG: universal stress protein [Rhizobiaceae bacterium]|nr:universal stress protein [Rhizobiaceae bacterium]